jgi:radical SAM superfamily enzyme YgiQ (UPF0313 family)
MGTPVSVGLVQINNSFSGQSYLPYTVGLMQAYAQHHAADAGRYAFAPPIYKRLHIDGNVERLKEVDITAFSAYVWNVNISLATAQRLRRVNPDCLIVFGGPQVPDRTEDFLRHNAFIDVAVNGPGEETFLTLLETYPKTDWGDIAGISYIDADGGFVTNPPAPRLNDLSQIPSPYLSGTFDALMDDAGDDETWIALWETNRGCPYSCTFCDWGSLTASKLFAFEMDRIKAEIDWFSANKIEFIFCCDANFGILPRDVDIARYAAHNKNRLGYPHALSVQNTKNATERAYLTQKILNDAGLNKGVTVSFQSLDEATLKHIKRDNISLDTYEVLQHRFTADGVATYTDLILGLPGETYQSYIQGIGHCIENGQHNRIQFNNLSILPNAEMGSSAYQKRYGMKIVESRSVNIHGATEDLGDGIFETQQLVVATNSMPAADWRRARAFSWMTALLHFDKLLQLPLLVAFEAAKASFTTMIDAFMNAEAGRYPLIAEIGAFFVAEAGKIQHGGVEYIYAPEWLGIHWPADEYMFIKMARDEKLDQFYAESEAILAELTAGKIPQALLHEAVAFNRQSVRLPFLGDDIVVDLNYDFPAFWADAGKDRPLIGAPNQFRIGRSKEIWASWDDWMREVVWYGNKKGAYLYAGGSVDKALAGHH